MSLVSEIKCARCDRKYSGVRSRCPYCGARRIGRGKYTEDSDNAKGKMLISVIVMGVLVVAVGVLLFTTEVDAEATPPGISAPIVEDVDVGNQGDFEAGVETMPGENRPEAQNGDDDDLDDYLGDPEDNEGPPVTSIGVFHGNNRMADSNNREGDFTAAVGDQLTFSVRIEPVYATDEITWYSSNESVFDVVPLNTEGTQARLTMTGSGRGTLYVTVGGLEARTIVRVR